MSILRQSNRLQWLRRSQTKAKRDHHLVDRVIGHQQFGAVDERIIIWSEDKTPAAVLLKDMDCHQLNQEYNDRLKSHGGNVNSKNGDDPFIRMLFILIVMILGNAAYLNHFFFIFEYAP